MTDIIEIDRATFADMRDFARLVMCFGKKSRTINLMGNALQLSHAILSKDSMRITIANTTKYWSAELYLTVPYNLRVHLKPPNIKDHRGKMHQTVSLGLSGVTRLPRYYDELHILKHNCGEGRNTRNQHDPEYFAFWLLRFGIRAVDSKSGFRGSKDSFTSDLIAMKMTYHDQYSEPG
jgi:hypothetical protein